MQLQNVSSYSFLHERLDSGLSKMVAMWYDVHSGTHFRFQLTYELLFFGSHTHFCCQLAHALLFRLACEFPFPVCVHASVSGTGAHFHFSSNGPDSQQMHQVSRVTAKQAEVTKVTPTHWFAQGHCTGFHVHCLFAGDFFMFSEKQECFVEITPDTYEPLFAEVSS